MKGYKTLVINIGGAALVGGLTYAAGVDWTQYVSPSTALMVVFGVNTVLRLLTTTKVGRAQ